LQTNLFAFYEFFFEQPANTVA